MAAFKVCVGLSLPTSAATECASAALPAVCGCVVGELGLPAVGLSALLEWRAFAAAAPNKLLRLLRKSREFGKPAAAAAAAAYNDEADWLAR